MKVNSNYDSNSNLISKVQSFLISGTNQLSAILKHMRSGVYQISFTWENRQKRKFFRRFKQ